MQFRDAHNNGGLQCTWSYVFLSFLTAVPTAELEPITENYVQADEVR